MLFAGMDVVALVIMTFLLVSHSCRSVPEDTALLFRLNPVSFSTSFFPIIKGLSRALVALGVNQCF